MDARRTANERSDKKIIRGPVCTENFIRVDDVMESNKLAR
jgi:hypothetical protein